MSKYIKWGLVGCALLWPFLQASCTRGRPPKPGRPFVWVKPHTGPNGVFLPGHWKYVGGPKSGQVWVLGHYGPGGKWIPGHWKSVGSPRPGGIWIPGHRGPRGRWIPGHWRR
jgi:hypothetical protein